MPHLSYAQHFQGVADLFHDDVVMAKPSTSTRRVTLWPVLLTLAVALIPFDILVRRLG